MDASTDPHVIRANPKFLYNIWTLDTEVVIKNHRLYHNRIRYHTEYNVYRIGPKSHDLITLFQTIK